MNRRILIIQGHPDRETSHFCHGLAAAYRKGAEEAGFTIDEVIVSQLDFPMLTSEADWQQTEVADDIVQAQEKVRNADHLVLIFPLWLGTMPAMVKAFLEQLLRPGFAFDEEAREGPGGGLLKGKSARVIITMGMPGLFYRWYFGAHGYRNLKRNILKFCGIKPVKHCFVGLANAGKPEGRQRWLQRIESLGHRGA
ncbi:NAD(P)H-dependent oxidoreductase [Wenzhouxiangella sp. AB-CW3]|uniref:NAD(P)H-dependent oxidoreductase n=1 Tax=Wenzhouxiangella sp. AB-CW3 TaxID=2771012 RepID=UPI00168BE98C|nr:NAD(P)H-dependent oxidoreductase [Wenzhouxiangella sp. AB-CW3]QOC21255.1 NAD(P)H-dependent oxidoreductase [Wenzhouxiangella sp. AB-CW3]